MSHLIVRGPWPDIRCLRHSVGIAAIQVITCTAVLRLNGLRVERADDQTQATCWQSRHWNRIWLSNPSLSKQLFGYAILGFALAEAMALFALMVAFFILFAPVPTMGTTEMGGPIPIVRSDMRQHCEMWNW